MVGCDPNASCRLENGHPKCICPPHMEGDGTYCLTSFGEMNMLKGSYNNTLTLLQKIIGKAW